MHVSKLPEAEEIITQQKQKEYMEFTWVWEQLIFPLATVGEFHKSWDIGQNAHKSVGSGMAQD